MRIIIRYSKISYPAFINVCFQFWKGVTISESAIRYFFESKLKSELKMTAKL